jgi:hypothetical protein
MPGPNNPPQIVTRVLADPVRMFLPSEYWNRARDYFVFALDFNTLTASVNTVLSFTVQNDSDFLILNMVATAATAAAGTAERAYWAYLVSIQDTSSGANWISSNNAGFDHIQNVFGRWTGGTAAIAVGEPGILQYPRFIPRAATVTVTVNNLSANADRLWLSFQGLKIYSTLRQGA